ncbi:MAG: rhombosortase [Pirellula sp.]|jgi:rhomboid family GlyGly-CTERM serine protease|nr:rhombosortase [Pirellula sp.]
MTLICRIPVTLLIGCFVLLIQVVPSLASPFEFQWKQDNPLLGYRLISCHAVHWSWNHLAWDLLMFVFLGAICEATDRFRFLVYLAASAIVIPHVVVAYHPELSAYRGLSGIDSGLFCLIAVDGFLQCRSKDDQKGMWVFAGCFLCLAAKLAAETAFGGNIFVRDTSFVPVPIAHLAGATTGALMVLLLSKNRESKGLEWHASTP